VSSTIANQLKSNHVYTSITFEELYIQVQDRLDEIISNRTSETIKMNLGLDDESCDKVIEYMFCGEYQSVLKTFANKGVPVDPRFLFPLEEIFTNEMVKILGPLLLGYDKYNELIEFYSSQKLQPFEQIFKLINDMIDGNSDIKLPEDLPYSVIKPGSCYAVFVPSQLKKDALYKTITTPVGRKIQIPLLKFSERVLVPLEDTADSPTLFYAQDLDVGHYEETIGWIQYLTSPREIYPEEYKRLEQILDV
jgi:hypothetical protein